jgi:predicted ABC-type ATPase
MPSPTMFIVAGPPGSGKSSRFPLRDFGVDFFNADNRAAELNGGSFGVISAAIRKDVNQEFEQFIADHTERRISFAMETTLRSGVTFEQARNARENGFRTEMYYVALDDFRRNMARVTYRAKMGGHSASQSVLFLSYERSMANLAVALLFPESGIERLRIFDNSQFGLRRPRELLGSVKGRRKQLVADCPQWLEAVIRKVDCGKP